MVDVPWIVTEAPWRSLFIATVTELRSHIINCFFVDFVDAMGRDFDYALTRGAVCDKGVCGENSWLWF